MKIYLKSRNQKKDRIQEGPAECPLESFSTEAQSMRKNQKKHDRLVFILKNGQKLIYNDVRKFGFIKVYNSQDFIDNFHLKNLGPEPLNKSFNLKVLTENRSINKKINGIKQEYNTETAFKKTDIIAEVSTEKTRDILWSFFNRLNIKVYSQKTGWNKVKSIEDLPTSHRQGSIFISENNTWTS